MCLLHNEMVKKSDLQEFYHLILFCTTMDSKYTVPLDNLKFW